MTASGVAARDARSQAAGPRGLFRWKRPARTGITPLFGVEYSSGARAANVNDLRPEVQTEDVLILRTSAHGRSSGSFLGSAGVSRSITCSYWLSPLPPAGPVRFVCAWPECGIPEHRVEIECRELATDSVSEGAVRGTRYRRDQAAAQIESRQCTIWPEPEAGERPCERLDHKPDMAYLINLLDEQLSAEIPMSISSAGQRIRAVLGHLNLRSALLQLAAHDTNDRADARRYPDLLKV